MDLRHQTPTTVRGSRRRWAGLAAAVLAAAGCGAAPAPDAARPVAVAERWIEDEPFEVFDPAGLLDVVTVGIWHVGQQVEAERWSWSGMERPRAEGGSLVVRPTGPDPRLERRVRLASSEVDVVEVDLRGVRSGRVELYWAGAGQLFSPERRLALPASHGAGTGVKTFSFPVGLHPEWRGTITRLRLDPASTAARILHLRELRAGRWSATGSEVRDMVSRPWKVRIGDDVRTARVAVDGEPWERTVEVRSGDVLRLGFGLLDSSRTGARFSVEGVGEGGRSTVLLDRRLGPASGAPAWRDVRLPLDRLAGRSVRIRLSVDLPGDADPVRDVAAWSDPVLLRPAATPAPNIVMICLDTLRADRMSLYGHDRPTTPAIDAWASQRAVVFEHAVAPAPWTLPSHVSLFTGLDAPRHGVNHSAAAPAELDMLAERLRTGGWVTAAITGGGILRPRYRFTQGFDSFAYWSDESSARELEVGLERATRWLDAHADEPFFLFFHTYEVHYPHRRRQPYFDRLARAAPVRLPPTEIQMRPGSFEELVFSGDHFVARGPGEDDWRTGLADAEVDLVRTMYDSAVAYADDAVGRLLAHLERIGVHERTVVVLLSDHGEALGEDGRAGHSYLDDYNLMVPLVVELPGRRAGGRRVSDQVRLVDVMPTLLEAVGLAPPPGLDGVSLLPAVEGRAAPPATAVAYAGSSNRGLALRVDGRVKYVVNNAAWSEIAGDDALFDLVDDPAERRDLAAADPRAAELRRSAFALLEETHSGIRLRIANHDRGVLEARFTGSWHDQARVKTLDPDCRCVHWESGAARVELATGDEVSLVLEAERPGPAGFEGVVGAAAVAFEHDVDLPALTGIRTLRWTGDGWVASGTQLGPRDTGFELRRLGPRPAELSDSRTGADDAIEQLRALGYVE